MNADRAQALRAAAPASAVLHKRAVAVLAGGVSHDGRNTSPFPVSMDRARGSRKWDLDGNEYVDYVMGHGALLLGHGHPGVLRAVEDQLARGTHYGASHALEVEWAELVRSLAPQAERIRFTNSGTEATMLAARVARARTGRHRILKLAHHFHGWGDVGVAALHGSDVLGTAGVSPTVRADVLVSDADAGSVERALAGGDVAGLILEPSGARFGQLPFDPPLLTALRELTAEAGTLLIFDEVVTGFRWSAAGAGGQFGVASDLTTFGKVLGGGLPAGALAGSADAMQVIDAAPPAEPVSGSAPSTFHAGTFNANPLSAAAGLAALQAIGSPAEPIAVAAEQARRLRAALTDVLTGAGTVGRVYGASSTFHVHLGETLPDGTLRDPMRMRGPLGAALRGELLRRGVDLLGTSGFVSSAHTDTDTAATARAFRAALGDLAAAGWL